LILANKDIKLQARLVLVSALILLVASCSILKPRKPGIGQQVNWSSVGGWTEDTHADAWPALLSNCIALRSKTEWQSICKAAEAIDAPSNTAARLFFEKWFVPHELLGKGGKPDGLITGYYEPLLFGSTEPDSRFRYPLYQQPDSLLTIDLGDLYPELKNKRVRGLVAGHKVIPFYSREQIESDRQLLAGNELVWIDDRDAVFFLHIQGSGRIQLRDGSVIGAGYSDQNGHPYVAIGRLLLERGELDRDEISLFTIRQWLRDNPGEAELLLNQNPSYVFFELREDVGEGPVGSLNVPLTPQRSIAIDPKTVPLGTPVWLQTNIPGAVDLAYNRLVIAQDTGGAIKGPLRADLFWGHGQEAENNAGIMKERGSMLVLLPRPNVE
jgi:membrane-bound lytic murein transglycosylase A